MQRLTANELTAITNIGTEQLKSMRRRGHIATAFGGDNVLATSRYVPADAVALLLAAQLSPTYGAKWAAQLVRMFGDVLVTVIAQAEADRSTDASFAIVDLVGPGGQACLACCFAGSNYDVRL